MLKTAAPALLLFALASAASADVIYTYRGNPFTPVDGNWDAVFGAIPTQITAIIDVPAPFAQPQFPNIGPACSSVGITRLNSMYTGMFPAGFVSASISDGVRTFTPDVIFLAGCGTTIAEWAIAGGSYLLQGSSDDRAISTSNHVPGVVANGTGDFSFFTTVTSQVNRYDAIGPASGQWTAVVTPEVNTGALALISGSLLLLGYRRRSR